MSGITTIEKHKFTIVFTFVERQMARRKGEGRATYKDGSPFDVEDFRLEESMPHIVLKADETPEDKLREMKF